MSRYSSLVSLPSHSEFVRLYNVNLTNCRRSTMMEIFGAPGRLTTNCSSVTNPKLLEEMSTVDIGPFRAYGLTKVLERFAQAFAEVKLLKRGAYDAIQFGGMTCCRKVRGGSGFSNHSWGAAIDFKFDGEYDPVNDDKCQFGLLEIAPILNAHGFYWGAGFSREDAMHFEASDELIRRLYLDNQTLPVEYLKYAPFAANAELNRVYLREMYLSKSANQRESVGLIQDALNVMAEKLNNADISINLGNNQYRGYFGNQTKRAIENYQSLKNLGVDGIVGADTLSTLDKEMMENARSELSLSSPMLKTSSHLLSVASGSLILSRGSSFRDAVALVQDALNLLSDGNAEYRIDLGSASQYRGIFGAMTERAITSFQSNNQLSVDGVIGKETIKKIDAELLKVTTVSASNLEHPDGYKPPQSAIAILGDIPLNEATKIEWNDFRERPAALYTLPGGELYCETSMQTDADGSPRAPEIDVYGQYETSFRFLGQRGQAKFPDAEKVNYFVLPDPRNPRSKRFYHQLGIKLGDVAAIIYDGKVSFAFFADVGPVSKIGEGSIHLVESLGHNPWAMRNGRPMIVSGIDDEVIYIIFKNSAPARDSLTPSNVNQKISTIAKRLFKRLGGVLPT